MRKILLFLALAFTASQAIAQDEDGRAKAKEEVAYQSYKAGGDKQEADKTRNQTLKGYEDAAEKANDQYNSTKGSTSTGNTISK